MWLSFFASFHWAGKERYALKIGILIVLFSLASTIASAPWWVFWGGPIPVLSFPFYKVQSETFGPPRPGEEIGEWRHYYTINFLAREVYKVFPIRYDYYQVSFAGVNMGYASYPLTIYVYVFPFCFFMLVNVIGALLGFWAFKMNLGRGWKRRWMVVAAKSALGVAVLAFGILFFLFPAIKIVDGRSVIYQPLIEDGFAFSAFGATWLVIVLVETIRGNAPNTVS